MSVVTQEISVVGKEDCGIVNITDQTNIVLKKSKIKDGIVTIFCVGSTGGITTIEYEQNLSKDLSEAFDRLIPLEKDYHHHKTWGDFNGGSHLRATLMGPSLTVPFKDKKLILGTWQQVIYVNFDRIEKARRIVLQIIGE